MKWLKKWAPRLLTILAAAGLLFVLGRAVILFLDYNRILIGFPFNVDYGEGPILDQVMRLSRFETIYPKDISQPPYIIGNYPPMYQLAQLPFAWIFGPAFWYGRLINLVSILAAAYFIGASLYTITKDTVAAVAGGLMLMVIPYILHWSGFVRVDSFALGLSWAALYCIIRHPNEKKYRILTAVFLTLAIFTRQSYGLAAPFAAFVWLLSHKPRRRAFELALWTAGFSIVFFGVLYFLSGGGVFFNIITANVNPFFWGTVKNYWQGIQSHMGYLVISSGLYVLAGVWLKQKAWWVAAPYLMGATLSGMTIGKDGSNVNYLFEFSAALALMSGAVLAWAGTSWQGTKWEGKRWALKVAAMVLLVLQVSAIFPWTKNEYYQWASDRALNQRDEIAQMVELVKNAENPVLADEFMGLVVLGGQELAFQPFEYKQLAGGNIWDQIDFISSIFGKEYDLILLYDPPGWDSAGARWTQLQLDAIRGNYREIDRLADTLILVPRDPIDINS